MKIEKNYKNIDKLAQNLIDIYLDGKNFNILCDKKTAKFLLKRWLQFDDKTRVGTAIDLDTFYKDEYLIKSVAEKISISKARDKNKNPKLCWDNGIWFVQKNFVGVDFSNYIPNDYFDFTIGE